MQMKVKRRKPVASKAHPCSVFGKLESKVKRESKLWATRKEEEEEKSKITFIDQVQVETKLLLVSSVVLSVLFSQKLTIE